MVEHSQPDGLVSRYEYDRYDADGKVLKSSNNLGEEWTFAYRKDHTVVTDALGRTEVYGFDENRELVYRIDADGQRSDSERDDYGRITVERDPLGRETRYLYDTEGNVIAITAPDGSSTQIDYHETLNLPIAVNDPAGRITAYDYDKRGNLISITDPAGYTTSYGYNAQWLPETITDALGKTRRLHYDTLDQLVCFTDCTGETTRFGYTEYGDLETVTDALGHTFAYAYDPMGRLKSQRTIQNGTPTPRGKQNPLAGGAVNRRYAYDKAGNLIQSADQRSGVLNYVYDKIGRIQEARNSQTGRSETFAFDPAHNILSDKTAEGKGKGSNVSSGNRLKEYNGIEYTYDALGNLIYRQLPDGENQYYQYDLENQLVRAEIKKPAGNTEIWTYAYDPFGRRLSKERQDKLAWTSTDPKRTHFVWDGTRLLQEYTYKGCYTYIYTDQDSYEPLAQVFHNNQDEGQYLAYFHNDQIGIPREMTDIHGNLLWYGEYTAWGRLKKDERVYKNAHQPFRLQNQYFDEETGLHYNLMRYYEPEAGRFVNQDPIGLLGGSNLYRFAPNAQGWTDPSGFIAMALVFLPEIGAALTALGQAALTAIGIGAVLSLSGDTSKEKSQAKAQVKAGACHGNCKSSKKPQHGYKIYDKRTGQIMEYGISGQTRTKADYFKTENNSPRIRSKLRVKYGGDPNYAGSVMIDGLPNREAALAWEKAQVRAYRAANNGARPPKQYRP